jgi:hypothetical protein
MGAFRQDQMDVLQRGQQGEGVRDHSGVGIFLVEARRRRQEIVERLDELRSDVGRIEIRNGLAHERQPIVVDILVGPAWHGQPILFGLDEAPDEIVQRPQGIELKFGKRIVRRTAPVLRLSRNTVRKVLRSDETSFS